MQFICDGEVAAEVGAEAAIVFKHLCYWVERNEKNNRNFINGHYWTYNSARAFSEIFFFIQPKTIARILLKLEKLGYIKSAVLSKNKSDRTKWYTIGERGMPFWKGYSYVQKSEEKCESHKQWINSQEENLSTSTQKNNEITPLNTDKNNEIFEQKNVDSELKNVPALDRNEQCTLDKNEQSDWTKVSNDDWTKLSNGYTDINTDIKHTDNNSNKNSNIFISSQKKNEEEEQSTKSNSSQIPLVATPQEKKTTYKKTNYLECIALLNENKQVLRNALLPCDETEYDFKFYSKQLKRLFDRYGVEKTKKGIANSINNSWLVNNTHYSLTALFSDKIFPQCISNSFANTLPNSLKKRTAYTAEYQPTYSEVF